MTIVTMTDDDEEENSLEPEAEGTASSHLLGQTNNGLDCNHEKKRGTGVCVCVGAGGEVRSVCVHRHKFTECTSKLYYDDRTPPTHPPPTSLQVFLTPAPLPNLLSRSPFLLFLCRTWDLLPVDGKSLCVIVKLCIVYVCVWRKNTEHVNDCV